RAPQPTNCPRPFSCLLLPPRRTPRTSLSAWRLRLAGGKPPRLMACNDLLSVPGGQSAGTPKNVFAPAIHRSLVPGRPDPVLDATWPSSPVFSLLDGLLSTLRLSGDRPGRGTLADAGRLRIHLGAPAHQPGALRHRAVFQLAPQGDQQLARQGH